MLHNPYSRRKTQAVYVGQIGIGGDHPIRIQSMLTSDTKNTEACLNEIRDLVAAGCEIVRLTVPTKSDLQNLSQIRAAMQKANLNVPLVADIHFTPSIAMDVVDFVEKVRINPGNFADKKLFKNHEYTDEDYQTELKRIEEKFTPLVLKCKAQNVAMRIGTNHGSLSDRILSRYGDTPEGMVESALEFLRIAEKNQYYDIILSMKASNVGVMITAYRLLAKRLEEENLKPYPFHLGVTEAGDGEDGRIKSAMGIGTLLDQGIGDTIRVSLTEDSVHEIPVAYAIAAPYNQKFSEQKFLKSNFKTYIDSEIQNTYTRRETTEQNIGPVSVGSKNSVRVWASFGHQGFDHAALSKNSDPRFEGVEFWPCQVNSENINELKRQNQALGLLIRDPAQIDSDFSFDKITLILSKSTLTHLDNVISYCHDAKSHLELCIEENSLITNETLTTIRTRLSQQGFTNLSWSLFSKEPLQDYRKLTNLLKTFDDTNPVNLRFYSENPLVMIRSSIELGGLLIDGIGDSIQLMHPEISYDTLLSLSYGILQASRVRMSKTEYIACPSCGRTLFNLQTVTNQIKERTRHLKGVKIGIMGCIVNGPGEMADADFGYVGTGTGKISLYVGQDCVERNIPEENAVDNLIALIKAHGKWHEPQPKAKAS